MPFYIRKFTTGSGEGFQTWRMDDGTASMVGITNPENGPNTFFRANPGEDIIDAIRRQCPFFFEPNGVSPFHRLVLEPGQHYPRIARPTAPHVNDPPNRPPSSEAELRAIAIARSQLTILARRLDGICQTVHPEGSNLGAYGNEIRNLLILACTEIESHWRSVLFANGWTNDRPTTNDYVLLEKPMKLGEYVVSFPQYPWLAPFRPFQGWGTTGNPTKELAWYDSYNSTKHDRERNLASANLEMLFQSVAAAAIMLVAQFGFVGGLGQRTEVRDFFNFVQFPAWDVADVYSYPYDVRDRWEAVNYPFP